MFPTIDFLAQQILRIVGSQIQSNLFFLQLAYLPTLKDVVCSKKNFERLMLASKNWYNDIRASCKSPNGLVEFIEMDEQLEEDLQKFEGQFERDEIQNIFLHFLHFFHVWQPILTLSCFEF